MRAVAFLLVVVAAGCGADKAESDPYKAAAIAFIKAHADDPSGLEILEWSKLDSKAGTGQYLIRFRCKKIGNAADGSGPVSVDSAGVFFRPEGKGKFTTQVDLMQCNKLRDWAP